MGYPFTQVEPIYVGIVQAKPIKLLAHKSARFLFDERHRLG
jgi:hypothetical protein